MLHFLYRSDLEAGLPLLSELLVKLFAGLKHVCSLFLRDLDVASIRSPSLKVYVALEQPTELPLYHALVLLLKCHRLLLCFHFI
jgi:hypothetical protein